MPLVVRPFHAADAPACGAIVGATPLWQRSGTTADRATHFLASAAATGDTLLVLDDGGVVGFAWIDRRGAFGRSAYLRMIAVTPTRRSSGLGARLLAAFEAIALQEGPDAFLLVSDFNADARRFYRAHGYVETGRIPGYVSPDADEILMWKRLTAPA